MEVDLQLDSRVKSAMSGEQVLFSSYGQEKLTAILRPRLERAFRDEALSDSGMHYGIWKAARHWGDARKALTLFRHAGELANEYGLATVTEDCLDESIGATEKAEVTEKLLRLPFNQFQVLVEITNRIDTKSGEIAQPVTTDQIVEFAENVPEKYRLGDRAVRVILNDLELLGLIETWIDSRGRQGRVKQVETTFDPQWVRDAMDSYLEASDQLNPLQEGT